MKQLNGADVLAMPALSAAYAKKTFVTGIAPKWIPAGLVALFVDLGQAFDTLFWIIVLLWGCDFAIGGLRAWHDTEVGFDWAKAFRSVLKLVVIAFAVIAVHLMEHLAIEGGIDTQEKLTAAVLLVIGVSEAFSILDNLCYFFPQMGGIANKIRGLLGKARNGGP